jgi:hypothetical protein
LIDGENKILVGAIETAVNRGDAIVQRAAAAEGVVELTRSELQTLLTALDALTHVETTVSIAGDAILVRAVENAIHYRGRAPGTAWMPSTGEVT